ncbi:hypothetical protein [uncultured Albimonas sp.]|uniref:hypothetical protein n=1 Tax=uncultured Albimonas sp. TaxID=1331701 RepID=UPI0030EF1339|tara:strand:+ start:1725 stop:2195 length:471 start_codon:yes stop_codon:yes gene_type:complete
MIRASLGGRLLAPLQPAAMPKAEGLDPKFLRTADTGPVGVCWLISMVAKEGIVAGVEKAAEPRPIAAPWRSDELQREQGMKTEKSAAFDLSSDPATQALMSRRIGAASLLPQASTHLSDEEVAAVSGTPAIPPACAPYLDIGECIKATRETMPAAA